MAIITGTALESNRKFRVNFDGGNLSSDGGLLLLKEFYHKLGVNSLLRKHFHTTDSASFRIHKDYQNLLQMLYQITGAYFQDDHADSLRNDPVLNAVIGKTALASQPTLSRFHNRMDERSWDLFCCSKKSAHRLSKHRWAHLLRYNRILIVLYRRSVWAFLIRQ